MSTMMRAAQVTAPEKLELVERPLPQPGVGQVRIRVHACGICHSDAFTMYNHWPGITYPRIPGHEIAGTIDAVGEHVTTFKAGDRVGVGWHGGHDFTCEQCRRGDFILCANSPVPGIAYDGGYAEYMVAPHEALARIPDGLSFAEAAPLMCAGVTTYNALRHSGAIAGDTVAVLGVGGLGHLGVQFAAKMGFNTIAIARGADKGTFAKSLGAHHYIDSTATNFAEELQKLGGARVILATVTDAATMSAAVGGLGVDGKLLIVGATPEPISTSVFPLIGGRRSIAGWPSGIATDSEDTMRFAVLTGVRAHIETMPLDRAREAFDRMMSGAARFRMVLTAD